MSVHAVADGATDNGTAHGARTEKEPGNGIWNMKVKNLVWLGVVASLSVSVLALVFGNNGSAMHAVLLMVLAAYVVGLHLLALWSLLRRRERAQAVIVNVSILIITVSLLGIGAEYLARFMFRDITTTGDNLSYFSQQWRKTVRLNSFGFRGHDFDLHKHPGTYRIAVIGDSLAYGQGIAENDRFSDLIEKHLQGLHQGSYEVLNFGVPGAETRDEVATLADTVLTAQPDFILLQWYTNDVQGLNDKRHAPRAFTIVPARLRWDSALFYLIHRQINAFEDRAGLSAATYQYLLGRFKDPASRSSVEADRDLRTFIDICKQSHIPLGIVLFSQTYFNPRSPLDFLLERTMQICKDENLRCVDTRPLLEPYRGDTRLWADRFDPHPSALANRLVAKGLINVFDDEWRARRPRTASRPSKSATL
jgi:hypothetical protein